ncbi:hypothetical protein LTS17_011507 [Exophiala oligosperma]
MCSTHYSINHNSGQHCQANSRALVHKDILDEYLRELARLMDQVTVGDPSDPKTFQGPQVDKKALDRILSLVIEGAKDGKLVRGGRRHGDKEEIFGPVIIVNTFEDEAGALAEANCVEFGLFSSVYTKDFERAIRVAKALQAGDVGVNCSVPLRALDMPIGGWKQSGIGSELSLHGLSMYTELKTVFLKYGTDPTTMSSKWHCS